MPSSYLPILLILAIAAPVAVGILALSWLVGGHKGGARKLSTYESGMPLYDIFSHGATGRRRAHLRSALLSQRCPVITVVVRLLPAVDWGRE